MESLNQAVIFLLSAVLLVPLFRFLGLGAVLGYLCAGILIGPFALNLISDVEQILHFAELGVVLLLFIIGLELQPSRLWALRHSIFLWGTVQMLATTLLLALVGLAAGVNLKIALLAGFTLSLSSTAFALQMLAERRELTSRFGRTAFAILLFQDIAVVPILALLPLLVVSTTSATTATDWRSLLMGLAIMVLILLGGRIVLRWCLRAVARTAVREIMTAATLLIVVGMALIIGHIGLSMALGAFLAGILLADSEFRHQLEADIEPFKGLLLGLFFIAVGMSVNLGVIAKAPGLVLGITLTIMLVKAIVLYAIGRLQGMDHQAAASLALSISQGGEFAFVVFTQALGLGVLDISVTEPLIVAVTVSMILTPLLLKLADRLRAPGERKAAEYDVMKAEYSPVIIAGFGRFGQITGRLLSAKRIPFTALEINPDQVDFVRRYGNRVYYGDASRLDLLHAAHADKAAILVLAIDEVEASLRTAAVVRDHFPNLAIYARARNRQHAYQLMDLGITILRRETFASALEIAGLVLEGLGIPRERVKRDVQRFQEHDVRRLHETRDFHADEEKMIALAKSAARDLEELFASDTLE